MIFRRSYSDPFRRGLPAACHGTNPAAFVIGTLTGGLGNGIDMAGKSQQAEMQANQATYAAQVARNNQQVATWNTQRALQQGQVDQDRQRMKTAQAIGTQRAQLASQGGDIDSGSDVDLVGDTARTGEYNAETIGNDAANKAWQYQLAGNSAAGQASLADSQASNDWLKFNDSLLDNSANQAGKALPVLTSLL
jgi:hypothetical protein